MNHYTEQSVIGETANDALVADATAPVFQYTARVDAVLAHAHGFEEKDFAELCLAAADQAGLRLGDQQKIARLLGLPDPEVK